MLEKTIILKDEVTDGNGNIIAHLSTYLNGDGSTPLVQTDGSNSILGFNDDGTPIIADVDDALIEKAQQSFMAEAIKVQKQMTIDNGGNPDDVNYINKGGNIDD